MTDPDSTPTRTFRTVVERGGKNATGMPVPEDVVQALGPGRRPAVRVTISGHTYRSTVASMGGRYLVPLSAEHRAAAGVAAGDEVQVTLQADAAPRDTAVPNDLAGALAQHPAARDLFERLAPSHRREWVRWVEEAKRPDTRARRVQGTVDALAEGRRTRS